ncbi:citryl-CoA lyase [Methylomonas sp. HYX-M1]|uniref:citryl-CoA lyase n=1 Tax=Methylomonas sp. HYX-M1 TaxID=3139307 RepID=UPI00345B8697
MSGSNAPHTIRTQIWLEEPEPDNPFATRAAYCRGYDVYGEMLGHARWSDMLYLLFKEEAPGKAQADLLDSLALALANPGPRDASVHAAMCGGVCGSSAASSLIAALAVGAGHLAGGREVFYAVSGWHQCGKDLAAWKNFFTSPKSTEADIWPEIDHPPGFDPYGVSTGLTVIQTLDCLAGYAVGSILPWLHANLQAMEALAGKPLALSGVAAAALAELGFSAQQSEMLFLLLRLPGAAAHALEQYPLGYKKFPFGTVELENDTQESTA